MDELGVREEGLQESEVAARKERSPNRLEKGDEVSPLRIFISQFQDFLIYMLMAAAAISVGVGFLPGAEFRWTEAGLIVLILLLNGIFGFIQDYRAEKSIRALREMSKPTTRVLRNGEKREVQMTEVVPGDIIFLESGSSVPADARLLEANNLETDESALTGESQEVSKETDTLDEDVPLVERKNMVFRNTTVVSGSGKAVVVETGMDTQVGDIAEQLNQAEERETPFQKEVDQLGHRLGYIILGVIALVTVFQVAFTSTGIITVLLAALSLAVAANPVGLPAAVTLALAMGSRKMLEKDVLVRRLNVIESIGSVDVIITDKTGTLTEEQMDVTRLHFKGEDFEVSGEKPYFSRHGHRTESEHLEPLLRAGLECNNAEKAPGEEDREYFGDPTEAALLKTAERAGLTGKSERSREISFSSQRKRMTVVTGEGTAYMKGAPEVVLERCDRIMDKEGVSELTQERKNELVNRADEYGSEALRTLAFARKQDADVEQAESDMVFLGLQGMIDPPRSEVPQAVEDCREAGVKVVMATGDDATTAEAIGDQIGFRGDAMETAELQELDPVEDRDEIIEREIFARVTPEDKVKILKAHQDAGRNVAMTGNGVNDAPALKNADVGVSMGKRGTDVAQQSSDMIVQDDNFASIRDAIEEGRGISDNIRNSVNYLLSGNMGEVLTVFFGLLLGGMVFPEIFSSHDEALILTPMMLLWINFISDGFPALALSTDPPTQGIMQKTESYRHRSLMDSEIIKSILYIGGALALMGMPLFFTVLRTGGLQAAQTALFTFVVLMEMVRVQAVRSKLGHRLRDNRWVVASLGWAIALQLLLLYTPVSGVFGVDPLGLKAFGYMAISAAGFVGLTWVSNRYLVDQ